MSQAPQSMPEELAPPCFVRDLGMLGTCGSLSVGNGWGVMLEATTINYHFRMVNIAPIEIYKNGDFGDGSLLGLPH